MIFFFTFKTLQLFLKVTKSILSSAQTWRQNKLEDQFKLITHSHIFSSCSSILLFGQYLYSSTSSAWESASTSCSNSHPAKLPLWQGLLQLLCSFNTLLSAERAPVHYHCLRDHAQSQIPETVVLYWFTFFISMKVYEI